MRFKVMGLVGAAIGFISLGLPWFSLASTEPSSYLYLSIPGIELLTNPGTFVTQGQTVPLTNLFLAAGIVFVLIGSFLALLHPLGGGVIFGGGTVVIVGVLLNARSVSGLGIGLSMAPSLGAYLAVAGGIVSLLGLAIRISVQVPRPPMRIRPATLPARATPTAPDIVRSTASASRSDITAGPHSAGGLLGIPGPVAVADTPATESPRICPRCGVRTHELVCPMDGTATRPAENQRSKK